MATVSGSIVKAYLYKGVWTLTATGTGGFNLRVGGTLSALIDIDTLALDVAGVLRTILGKDNYTISGAGSPLTITLAGDYAFSGISFGIENATSGATVSIVRAFPTVITTASEANGFYIMGAESSLDKTYNIESQDITNKESGGWKTSESQIRSISLSTQNYYLSTGNYDKLVKQFEKKLPVIICDIEPDVTGTSHIQNYGVYNINSLSQGAVSNEVVDFTADFELTGEPTRISATS